MRRQQLLNSTGLIQVKVYTNFLLGSCMNPLMRSCDVVFALREFSGLSLQCVKGHFSRSSHVEDQNQPVLGLKAL